MSYLIVRRTVTQEPTSHTEYLTAAEAIAAIERWCRIGNSPYGRRPDGKVRLLSVEDRYGHVNWPIDERLARGGECLTLGHDLCGHGRTCQMHVPAGCRDDVVAALREHYGLSPTNGD